MTKIVGRTNLFCMALSPLVSQYGKGFLTQLQTRKMRLVSDYIGKQIFDMYIDRILEIK